MQAQVTLSGVDQELVRKKCLRSLFVFCRTVMGYDDITTELHAQFCSFLEASSERKQATLPRSFVKTWIGTIAYSIWVTLPRTTPDEFPTTAVEERPPSLSPSFFRKDALFFVPLPDYPTFFVDPFYLLGPNMRILIASYVVGNAMKMINLIRKTYERNQAMQILFPDVIPENFNKVKWADTEACINRSENFTESTFESGGIGGSTTSRHYDLILEDDLIYANKDDFTGKELMPSKEDIDKAIGWHKLAMSLLVPGAHTRIHNIGTRWAKYDLIAFIRENEPDYIVFERACTLDGTRTGEPTWPEMYPTKKLDQIFRAQGPYMFATQYLNKPMAPEDMLFKLAWLQYYNSKVEVPKEARIFTTVDLSLWGETSRTAQGKDSRGVVITCAWDSNNHVWILRYDAARFNPSEIIELMYTHNRLFGPELIGVESVYYQRALVHFARLEMAKRGWLPLRELKTSTSVEKDVRIRALEPYAMNGAIHCRADHKDFITEFVDYVPGSKMTRKDILDALAYQLQVARPGEVAQAHIVERDYSTYKFSTNMDEFLRKRWDGETPKDLFDKYRLKELSEAEKEAEDAFEFASLLAPLDKED